MTIKETALLSADIDRFGDLDRELAEIDRKTGFRSKVHAHEKLSKQLRARFDTEPADRPCQAEGQCWTVRLSARSMKRIFKPGALKRLAAFLGDAFYKIADVPLGTFDDHVTILDRSKYVIEEQIGYRKIEAIEKPALLKAA